MSINANIFKKYDIRGDAEGEDAILTPEAARWIGLGFGTHLQRNTHQHTVVVGRDNRRSSYELSRALIDGLKASGCKVIDLDLVPTPVLYWQAIRHGNVGGIMVTGSSMSPSDNGFKLCVGNKNLFGSQLQAIRNFIESSDLTYGDGSITMDLSGYTKYVDDLAGRVQMARPLKVVIDTGNGMAGLFAPRLLKAWGHDLIECLYCELSSSTPYHPANPHDPENLRDLCFKVRDVGADLGIAFDTDADRIGVVDNLGNPIAADRILALLARDLLARHAGATIVTDVLASQATFDEIVRWGGKPVMWASGHSLVKAKVIETGALLGGEVSGHFFMGENYHSFDDGFMAMGRLLQLLAAGKQTLAELDETIPRWVSTPEYRPFCPEGDKRLVVDAVQRFMSNKGEISNVDGVRVKFLRGWGLIRASNTEPALSLRFEAATEADAVAYRDLFAEALKAYPQVGPF